MPFLLLHESGRMIPIMWWKNNCVAIKRRWWKQSNRICGDCWCNEYKQCNVNMQSKGFMWKLVDVWTFWWKLCLWRFCLIWKETTALWMKLDIWNNMYMPLERKIMDYDGPPRNVSRLQKYSSCDGSAPWFLYSVIAGKSKVPSRVFY